jgi:hypothetical protein
MTDRIIAIGDQQGCTLVTTGSKDYGGMLLAREKATEHLIFYGGIPSGDKGSEYKGRFNGPVFASPLDPTGYRP